MPQSEPAVLFIKKHLDRAELELVLEANRRGVHIHVISTHGCPGKERLQALGIFTEVSAIRSKFSPVLIKVIRQVVVRLGITIIHAPDSSSLANAIWASYFLDVRIIAYRGTAARIRRSDPTFWLGILHPRVSRVVCVNQSVYDYMSQHLSTDKLILIHKGYREDWLAEHAPSSGLPLALPPDAIVIMLIAVTRGRPIKGLAVLIEAMKLIECELAHLVVIGDYDPASEQATQETGVSRRVHFLGEVPGAAALLRFADIYVLPSIREGLPRSIKEAMAAGLPVVASNIPGPAELVSHEETGLLVEPGSAPALAAALDRLCADRPLRERMGAKGRERLRSAFGIDVFVEMTLNLYRELSR